ncbi:YbjN domain-containing protein [Roseinatronobacter alkalisoli]|uniref:YbjN domain-containing protein n=1 Tax=Roseinatronobacter alkalisoli TaxID=3028235 RepID=A0ABT5T305_9RHOB|nr:YbjN domain-containing protein [Roseinatronobacter sp. HJB301]MDD7969502.1 YbjN domain-containing protein [Roseinatronobacter sp. HJB301]
MRMSAIPTLIAFAGSLALAPAAIAQSLIDAGDVDAIANIARGYGSATIQSDNVGDPQILGRIDGVMYTVNFYGCTNGADCTTVQFRAGWKNPGDITLDDMNLWNQDKRFGKAYLDFEDDPVIEWDVNLFGGVSTQNLDDTFDWWRIVLENFTADYF